MQDTSLSVRFISAYNAIDRAMRVRYRVRQGATFTEALRFAAGQNAFIKKYEDELYSYGRLRNAIVHSLQDDSAIAEPHERVVEIIEHIEEVLLRPPLVTDVLKGREVVSIQADASVKDAILLLSEHRYSNIPVLREDRVIGMLTPKEIVTRLGARLGTGMDVNNTFLADATVGGAVGIREEDYVFMKKTSSIVDVIDMFASNRKLKAALMTNDGSSAAPVYAIVTAGDLVKFNRIVDDNGI